MGQLEHNFHTTDTGRLKHLRDLMRRQCASGGFRGSKPGSAYVCTPFLG